MSSKTFKVCPKCKTLNENVTYCINCKALIDLAKKREIAKAKKALNKKPKESPNQLTLFFENAKNHKFFLIRWVAKFFYSVWVLGLGIAFVFGMIVLYMAA